MVERVIVPLDGSDLAEKALGLGALLAQGGARLVLVSVTPPPLEPHAQAREATLSAYLDHMAGAVASDAVPTELEVLYGRPGEEIARFATPYDLIVMSTHGRSGLSRLLQGSVAAEVLALAPCPVALVRPTVDVPALRLQAPLAADPEAPADSRGWDDLLGPIDGFGQQALDLVSSFSQFARHRWPAEVRMQNENEKYARRV